MSGVDVRPGRVYWITGLSGAGKSTVCGALVDDLRARGCATVRLDGDELRDVFGGTAGHDRASRLALAHQYARLCRLLSSQGYNVAIATISMFQEIHAWNRRHLPRYFEVYLKVPLTELRRRDPKALYARAFAGEVTGVAGVDLPVDEPTDAHLTIEFEAGLDVPASVALIRTRAEGEDGSA